MKRAGDVLSALFDERLLKQARGYSKLFEYWAEVTQKNGIAAAVDHSRIREIERGILLVETDHPGWIQLLQTKESRILDDFRRRFPGMNISGISLILSKPGPQTPESSSSQTLPDTHSGQTEFEPVPLAPTISPSGQSIDGLYDTIKDEKFKESLKRLEQSIGKD